METYSITSLLGNLSTDAWRQEAGFSSDLDDAQSLMFRADSDDEVARTLNNWLERHQPCLFGRMAAKSDQLSFCILRDDDLVRGDEFVRDKIQASRTAWTRDGFRGTKSGFLILAVSESLALAEPNEAVAKLAQRLASLYLLEDVNFDYIHLEEIFLEQPGRQAATWRWDAGINYFASHGDKRWWHDHRIPGGIGFSVNSVGHMAKSGLLNKAMAQLEAVMGDTAGAHESFSKIDSLKKALEVAMRTINTAANTEWGRATELLPRPTDAPPCPTDLPHFLVDKDYREYFGHYHTDYTLPTEYFRPDVARPELSGHTLDFSYLFDDRIENPDYVRMGTGRRIRGGEAGDVVAGKLGKILPTTLPINQSRRLLAALA